MRSSNLALKMCLYLGLLLVINSGVLCCREEFEKVQSFAAELPVDSWVCCKLQMLNRPSAPVLVLLSKK